MKQKNKTQNSIISKSQNNTPIRVLYKKTGKLPETKIIDNVSKLKKAIVKKHLDLIPYESLYIICNNKKFIPDTKANIVLTFNSIYGDLILIDIDKHKREFKGLSQEDIMWYSRDLINKSTNNSLNVNLKTTNAKHTKTHNRNFERDNSNCTNFNFEKALINTLISMEMTLSTLLGNGGKNE